MPLFGKSHNDATVANNGAYDNTTANPNQGNFKHDVEGGLAGGIAGHEYQKHHDGTGGPGAATGVAAGAFGGHEFNKHHHNGLNNNNTSNGIAGTNGGYDNTTNPNQGNFRRDVEGGAAGGLAGHEYQKHHGGTGGPGVGTGVAAGAFGGHEYNKHNPNNNTNGVVNPNTDSNFVGPNGLGMGAGTGMPNNNATTGPGGMGAIAQPGQGLSAAANDPIATQKEARHLMRDGKIEKAVGSVLCSTTLKQKGLQKEATAESLLQQSENLAIAENLEAQAAMHRGTAVGLGAHPQHAIAGGQNGALGAGPVGATTGPGMTNAY